MMDKELLRKADIFSGALVILTGVLIVGFALQMPMKDSYGGVQNVWYVSPALFPLFVGAMLILLGGGLIRTALKAVGLEGLQRVVTFFKGRELGIYLRSEESVRYYGVVLVLLGFVFLLVPRVDFFPAAILFLLVLFAMYYCTDHAFLCRLLRWTLGWLAGYVLLFVSGLDGVIGKMIPRSGDWLTMALIVVLAMATRKAVGLDPERKRRLRISLLVAVTAPCVVGVIFKYFLLVPMPSEGVIVQALDTIWYMEF